jgi:hypothetical protein
MGFINKEEADYRLKQANFDNPLITASTTDLVYIPGVNNIQGSYKQTFFRIHPSIFINENFSNLAVKILDVVTSNRFYADYSFTIILSDKKNDNFYLWRGHQFARLFNNNPNHSDDSWPILQKKDLPKFLRSISFKPEHVMQINDISSDLAVYAIIEVIVQTISHINPSLKVEKKEEKKHYLEELLLFIITSLYFRGAEQ